MHKSGPAGLRGAKQFADATNSKLKNTIAIAHADAHGSEIVNEILAKHVKIGGIKSFLSFWPLAPGVVWCGRLSGEDDRSLMVLDEGVDHCQACSEVRHELVRSHNRNCPADVIADHERRDAAATVAAAALQEEIKAGVFKQRTLQFDLVPEEALGLTPPQLPCNQTANRLSRIRSEQEGKGTIEWEIVDEKWGPPPDHEQRWYYVRQKGSKPSPSR
jgi:hypothetical protein